MNPADDNTSGTYAESWRSTFANRWTLISLAALLYWVAAHSLRPFVALRINALGASAQEIGLVAAAYAFVALFLAIPGGRIIDRVGSTRVLYGALIAMTALGIAYAFTDTIPQLFGLQMINGVVELGVWLSIQTLVTHAGTGTMLARHLSLFTFAWGLGIAIGPTVGGLLYARVGFTGLAITYSVLATTILIAMRYAPVRQASLGNRGRLGRDAWHTAMQPAVRSVLLSSFVTMYIISIKNTFYPLALQDRGIATPLIGVLLSIMGVASLAVRVILPVLIRRFGPGLVLLVGAASGVVGISLTPWLMYLPLLAVGAALAGAGYGSNPPVVMQLLGTHSAASNRGLVMGMRAASGRLAQVLQPVVFGSLVTAVGISFGFPISGAVLAAILLWARRDLLTIGSSRPPPGSTPDRRRPT